MADTQLITDSSDLRKYRTEIPNIIDDLGLTAYEGRLYLHYKRVCGASGGVCTEGMRRTARQTKMSLGQLTKARDGLSSKGLIQKAKSGQHMHIRIVDIWEVNFAYFSLKERPDINDWLIEQLNDFLKTVSPREHFNNGAARTVSPREHFGETVSPREQLDPKTVSPRERKKELINKNQPEEQEKTDSSFSSLSSHVEIWQKASGLIAGSVTKATYDQILKHCEPRPNRNGTFVLAAPEHLRQQVQRLQKPILLALSQFTEASELEVIDL